MLSTRTRLHFDTDSLQGFRTAVSLHCHTQHSREKLDFVPHYANRIPIVSRLFRNELDHYEQAHGAPPDFARAWWTPPLAARTVFDLETIQIEHRLGMKAIVSITDHDEIEACSMLQVLYPSSSVPISLEWTVPVAGGLFHLGVHNLPPDKAVETRNILRSYTDHPTEVQLREALALLDELPETLVVLNHALWDIGFQGSEVQNAALCAFLASYGHWIHALEINGFRPWHENLAVLRLAEQWDYPVVSGGDRHGCEPNTVLNLTQARTFSEFTSEIRDGRISEIAILPEHRESVVARILESAADILRHYPTLPDGRQRWTDRVFVQLDGEQPRQLSWYWNDGGPEWLKPTLWVLCLLGSRRFRPALRLALPREVVAS